MAFGPIQTRPASLGALLTLKTRGQAPSALLEDVRPTIDLEQWWLRAKAQRRVNGATQVLAANFDSFYDFPSGPSVVPQNEWWYVHNFTVTALILAGGYVYNMVPGHWSPPVVPFRNSLCAVPPATFNNTTPNTVAISTSAEGFWAPPGATLGVYVGGNSATVQLTLNHLTYSPLSLADG